ncbi:hypothetical protein LXA43DRAFT_902946 [Ganoderma leucocontextum]|nr:hypothetical protein LXA43DRAFT_902946 [Ganoderma leucocontextum]
MRFASPIRVSAPGPIPGLRPPSPSILHLPRMKPRYSDRRGYVRGHLREDVDNKLREVTGDDEAGMYWTLEDYIESVVLQHGVKLIGWPPDIPFQNLSNIRGGAPVLTHLEHLWESGILKFVRITEDERLAASLNAKHLAPAPKCAHRKCPGGREDIGRGRYRYRTNPYGLPLRHPKTGPKTPKYVPAEWDD